MEEKEALHEKELRDVGRKEKKWERERIEEASPRTGRIRKYKRDT